jgi:hypothetical protein
MWIEPNANDHVFSNEEFDRNAAVQKILVEDYPHAKRAIYTLEVFIRKRSKRSIYELRDTLDHLSIALLPETTPAEARRHLAECQTHLRRASIEPFEYVAEKKVLQIEKIGIRGRWLHKFLMIRSEISLDGNDLIDGVRAISQQIVEGRICKATSKSLDHMKAAVVLADDLLSKIKPKQFYDRLYATCLCLFGALLGFVLKLAFDLVMMRLRGHP